MLGFPTETKHEKKCYAVHGVMGHLDPKQPPVKRKPFAALLNHDYIQQVELILPQELYDIIKDQFSTQLRQPVYSRVILPLKALLEGDFFNEYIKRGNILMLSEGGHGSSNVYSLKEGILTLFLDKESYERAGLVGKPDGVKGKRGTKPRWIVEINLRLPSMLHGKKGFERVVYAFKNVLITPVTWLFSDLGSVAPAPDPLATHFPTQVTVSPHVSSILVNMLEMKPPPESKSKHDDEFETFATETHEWLSLVSLNSPRIDPEDRIDSILSRYIPPGESLTSSQLVKITWGGFISPSWAHKTFIQTLLASPKNSWFSYSACGFGNGSSQHSKDCTILKLPDCQNEYLLWEVE